MLRYGLISILIIDFFYAVYGCRPVLEKKGDNLVVIAGGNGLISFSDVEFVPIENSNDLCDPLNLDYKIYSHSSVGTPLGVLTCGGWTGSSSTSKCVLKTKEGQTTTFPSMKRTRYNFGLGMVNDTVYAVGGWGGETTMEKINFKTDSEWTLTNLPFVVTEHCLATTTNSLVITGGYQNGRLDTSWVFNTETEEWTQGPKMKDKREYHSCFYDIKSNSIHIFGGWNGNKMATTEKWNLDTNQWESTSSLPEPLNSAAGVASKSIDYIGFVAGGSTNSGITNKIFGLRRRDLKWEVMPQQLQKARHGHSMINLPSDQVSGC